MFRTLWFMLSQRVPGMLVAASLPTSPMARRLLSEPWDHSCLKETRSNADLAYSLACVLVYSGSTREDLLYTRYYERRERGARDVV